MEFMGQIRRWLLSMSLPNVEIVLPLGWDCGSGSCHLPCSPTSFYLTPGSTGESGLYFPPKTSEESGHQAQSGKPVSDCPKSACRSPSLQESYIKAWDSLYSAEALRQQKRERQTCGQQGPKEAQESTPSQLPKEKTLLRWLCFPYKVLA